MNKATVCLALCGLMAACSSVPQADEGATRLPLVNFARESAMLFRDLPLTGPALSCNSNPCQIPVTLYDAVSPSDPSKMICSAALPSSIDVSGVGTKGPILLVWKLDQSKIKVTTYSYGFEPHYGILILSDLNSELKTNGLGDGGANPSSNQYFNATDKLKKKQTAAYFPIVLQGDKSGATASMCGAVDPIIVNSN